MSLPIYTDASEVPVSFSAPQLNGENITFTSATYTVSDELGTEITNGTIAGYTGGDIAFTIPGTHNDVADGARKLRVVRVTCVGPNGNAERTYRYIVEDGVTLRRFEGSFQTLDEAYLTATELVDIPGWEAATDSAKQGAMREAYNQMCRLRYRFLSEEDGLDQLAVTYRQSDDRLYTYVSDMNRITQNDWDDFTDGFKDALMKAQIVEADQLLAGDPVRKKRLDGIVSETIGESKMFFNARPPLSLPVSRRTLDILAGFFYFNNRIARA